MGCCASAPAEGVVAQPAANQPAKAPAKFQASSKDPLAFSNKPANAVGESSIPADRRVRFGMVFPESTGVRPAHMFFDKSKPVEKMITAAAQYGGFAVDKGKLVGSPERLNLFLLEGDVVRLDLEIEAHLGSTLRAGDTLILEKGNRLTDERLQAVRSKVSR